MSKTVVLAADAARGELSEHVTAAVEMIKDIAHADDKVIVLHVHEFAVGRFGRIQVDCADGQGERLVEEIAGLLEHAGLATERVIAEADYGHVARTILATAQAHGASMLVLGSHSRTDLPRIPFGSVANRILHVSSMPVLIVPMRHIDWAGAPASAVEAAGR